jgi:hypothetical protein
LSPLSSEDSVNSYARTLGIRPWGRTALVSLAAALVVTFTAATRAEAQTNTVSAGAASGCITTTQTCAAIPIQISRTDATEILGFSVTFTLSSNLMLCAPNVAEGTYLSASGPTAFQVVNLGGGQYRADGVILGAANCGSAAASGTLFTVNVTNTGGSGTGTVAIDAVTLRDCSNVTIASTIGASGSVTIDLAPVTIDAISDPTVAETVPLSVLPNANLSACATGPVTWSASVLPLGASINPSTGEVTWTPSCTAFESGPSYPVTIHAQAASLETASASFTIHVTNTPGTVTVSVGASFSVEEESPLVMAAPSAVLASCAEPPVTWSVSPALPAGATLSSSSGVVSWTPSCGQAGNYGPFTLTATAATGELDSETFSLVVTHKVGTVSIAPILSPTVAEGSLLTVTPIPTLTPCAATPLTWSATGLPSGAVIDTGTGVITWTPPCDAYELGGLYGPVNVTAQAATGEQGSRSFSINVTNTPIAIAAVSPLASVQGPGAGSGPGLSGITVSYSTPAGATAVEVYRAPYGFYPEYDDGGGAEPAVPSYPPGSPWVLTAITASGQVDLPASRDFWYYVAFAKNDCGDVSPVSVRTSGTLDYRLGDVTDGVTIGTGDNLVQSADVSYLGAHYGLTGAAVAPYAILDVGPTTTGFTDGRPTTDDEIGFEDLVIFAINFGLATFPRELPALEPSAERPEVVLARAERAEAGSLVVAELAVHGASSLAALQAKLSWDPAVVEPVAAAASDEFAARGGIVLVPKPGTIDAAALGAAGLSADGAVAVVTFRALASGDPRIRLESVDARDLRNRSAAVERREAPVAAGAPAVTQLAAPSPSPFHESTTLEFTLAQGGPVELAIYTVSGRLVKTLLDETRDAGVHRLVWDGRDLGGDRVGAGVYYAAFTSTAGRFTRPLVVLR